MAGDVAAALRGAPPESDGSRICGAGRGAAPTGEGRISGPWRAPASERHAGAS
jgi:hypothetical protein